MGVSQQRRRPERSKSLFLGLKRASNKGKGLGPFVPFSLKEIRKKKASFQCPLGRGANDGGLPQSPHCLTGLISAEAEHGETSGQ